MTGVENPAQKAENGDPPGKTGSSRPARWRTRRSISVFVVALLCGALAAGVVSDVSVRARLAAAHSTLVSVRAQLDAVLSGISSAEASMRRRSLQRDELRISLAKAQVALARTPTELSEAQRLAFTQGAGIATLRSCLDGVRQALLQIDDKDTTAAIASLKAAAPSCEEAEAASQGSDGPAYPYDFADPDVILVGGTFFAYATNAAGGNIQAISSTDLHSWTPQRDVLPRLPRWAVVDKTWAPSVIQVGSAFVLYYTASYGLTGRSCIGAAVSLDPLGPFVDDSSAPFVCPAGSSGAIDPSPYTDGSGNLYLSWVSDGDGSTNGNGPAIWAQQLFPSGRWLVGSPSELIHSDQPWEAGVVEGPSVLYEGGLFYLFYSGNNWSSAKYAIGYAVCQGPLGPCAKPSSVPLLSSEGAMAGPGGPSVFADQQGALWLAFHAYVAPDVGYPNSRELFIRSLSLLNGQPVLAG